MRAPFTATIALEELGTFDMGRATGANLVRGCGVCRSPAEIAGPRGIIPIKSVAYRMARRLQEHSYKETDMKTLIALITTAVLGTSSAAYADTIGRDHRSGGYAQTNVPNSAPIYVASDAATDARIYASYSAPRPRATWTNLGTMSNGRRGDKRLYIGGKSAGGFTAVKLRASDTPVYVKDLVIIFADGSRQQVSVEQRLMPGADAINVDLDGGARAIASVSASTMMQRGWHQAGVLELSALRIARSFRG